MPPPPSINELTEIRLERSRAARALLEKINVRSLRNEQSPSAGDFFANLAAGLLNRQVDIFDDAMFLIDNNRIGSACVISRGMIEAYALAHFAVEEVTRAFAAAPEGSRAETAVEMTLKFTNSSRFKKSEQEKLKKGIFKLQDYKFTVEAQQRMLAELGNSVHVHNALRYLYQRQKEETQAKESTHELVYDALSEWVHPSQTSVWLAYAQDAQIVETSLGKITHWEAAMNYCTEALSFITATKDIYLHMLRVADIISATGSSENF